MEKVIFDLETTGLSPYRDAILEIGAVVVRDGAVTDERFHAMVNPGFPIPYHITRINGINDRMVADAPGIGEVLPRFLEFVGERGLVAHNASFDMGFVHAHAARLGVRAPVRALCTVELSRRVYPRERRHNLDAVCERLGLVAVDRHRALGDVELTAQAFIHFQRILAKG